MSSRKIDFYGKTLNVYKSNLHTHTTVSDGRYSPQEVIARYQQQGYDVLALTDHGKFNPVETYDACGMTLLHGIDPGAEIPFLCERACHFPE